MVNKQPKKCNFYFFNEQIERLQSGQTVRETLDERWKEEKEKRKGLEKEVKKKNSEMGKLNRELKRERKKAESVPKLLANIEKLNERKKKLVEEKKFEQSTLLELSLASADFYSPAPCCGARPSYIAKNAGKTNNPQKSAFLWFLQLFFAKRSLIVRSKFLKKSLTKLRLIKLM